MIDARTLDPEALLDLSGERDAWLARLLDNEREAYRRGDQDGYARAHDEMAERWNRIATPIARGGPDFTELERRRWGPAGREHFGAHRPGDFPGRKRAA